MKTVVSIVSLLIAFHHQQEKFGGEGNIKTGFLLLKRIHAAKGYFLGLYYRVLRDFELYYRCDKRNIHEDKQLVIDNTYKI